MDFLKSAVASAIAKGPLSAYSVGERIELEESIWTLNDATKREDGSRCSVFSFDVGSHRRQLPLARNALRKCRTLRHPGVIKVLDTVDTDAQLCIITERLSPLVRQVRQDSLTTEAKKWGLWSIAKTVSFINNEAASVHACVRLSSVYTGESGEWKLGGFEVLSAIADDEAMVHAHTGLVPGYNRLMPPEVSKAGWGTYRQNPWLAVDAYGYAILVSDAFHGSSLGPAQPSELRGFPTSMHQNYKRLVNPNPKARMTVSAFLEQGRRPGGYFQTPLTSLAESLDSLGLKSDGEREEFVNDLNDVADQFPDDFLKHKILPELLKSVEFGGGGPQMFLVALRISAKLSEEDYAVQALPVIVRLFASPDRALRVCLLESLPSMIERLPKSTLNDRIFPHIVTGFADLAPLVREQTVKSVLVIIPKLSDRIINGELLKHLAKTANDTEPGIRTNTTICLGKIAKYLGPHTRTKVLVAAFTRSLRDPFVHARNAAVLALGATVDSFSEEDCANKILPALCPSLLDKEKIVRDQANKSLEQYIARVRRHAQSLPDTVLPSAPSGTVAGKDTPRMASPSIETSWGGWAISSFTNRLATANGDMQPNAQPTFSAAATVNARNGSAINLRPHSPAARASEGATKPDRGILRQMTDTTKLAQSFAHPEIASDDETWGDMDDGFQVSWDTVNEGLGIEAGFGHASDSGRSQSTSNRSSIIRSTNVSRAPATTSFDDQGEPDFAGWLKAKSNPKKPALPKKLGSSSRISAAPALSSASTAASGTKAGASLTGSNAVKVTGAFSAKTSKPAAGGLAEDDWGDAWT